MQPAALQKWHQIVAKRAVPELDRILHPDVVFHSPVVHTPQRGKAITTMYLGAAIAVLGNANFRYVREIADEHGAVLEFQTEIDGIEINGVDLIAWDEQGLITDFKVMVRPAKAMQLLQQKMAALLNG